MNFIPYESEIIFAHKVFFMLSTVSSLQSFRMKFSPPIPSYFLDMTSLTLEPVQDCKKDVLKEIFDLFPHLSQLPLVKKKSCTPKEKQPLKIGVVFSGGQAPGGHNVISGLFDSLKKMGEGGALFGFLEGPSGIISGNYKIISQKEIDSFRNTGGFDLLGSGRTKIETKEQFESSLKVCQELKLDGLVIVGGDDSNTNAALLAEYFHQNQCSTCVVGVPKTIDGDLKNDFVPLSFGFDTASKVYSELIGNLARDALSSKKYYHFIRLMGRTASHIALECALSTQPNYTLIAEEIFEKKMTLKQIVADLCQLVRKRALKGKNYGVVLIPEGLIEWIPEVSTLICELNLILAKGDFSEEKLTQTSKECFSLIPKSIQKQLLLVRDPHGNVQVSLIETERMLAEMVAKELEKDEELVFHALPHFFGYEGRSAFPTNFDASYCYSLGHVAALAVFNKLSGYMCFLSNLHKTIEEWDCGAVPLPFLMQMEVRKGKDTPAIIKALVDLKGKAFQAFQERREMWKEEDRYIFPGPIQFESGFAIPLSLSLEKL